MHRSPEAAFGFSELPGHCGVEPPPGGMKDTFARGTGAANGITKDTPSHAGSSVPPAVLATAYVPSSVSPTGSVLVKPVVPFVPLAPAGPWVLHDSFVSPCLHFVVLATMRTAPPFFFTHA